MIVQKDNYTTNCKASNIRLILKMLGVSIIANSEEQAVFIYDAFSAVLEFPGWLILVTELFA